MLRHFYLYLLPLLWLQTTALFAVYLEWAHERIPGFGTPAQTVPLDPNTHYGRLTNEFRFAWTPTGVEPNHCSLRLLVYAGSLREEEHEQGIAHFLEHMAFYNSKHYPNRTLIKWFEENGMRFGADLNAHTDKDKTEYEIDLKTCSPQKIEEALIVLRDFADGIRFFDQYIENEQGVIDAEERLRDTIDYRMAKKQLETIYAGSTEASRMPIGKKEIRRAFTKKAFQKFYKKWYRPDLMTLLAVGDFSDFSLTPLIHKTFSSMVLPQEKIPAQPNRGIIEMHRKEIGLSEPHYSAFQSSKGFSVFIQKLEPPSPNDFSLNFSELTVSMVTSFYDIAFSDFSDEHKIPVPAMGISTDEDVSKNFSAVQIFLHHTNWKEGVQQALSFHNSLLSCGFSPHFVEEKKKLFIHHIENKTETISNILEELYKDALGESGRIEKKFMKKIYSKYLEQLTAAQLNEVLRRVYSFEELKKFSLITMKDTEGPTTEEVIAFTKTQLEHPGTLDIGACMKEKSLVFQYQTHPRATPSGYVTEKHPKLEYDVTHFPNGIVVHTKELKDPSFLNKFAWSAELGHGAQQFPVAPNFYSLALNWFFFGGTQKHSFSEMNSLLSGSNTTISLLNTKTNTGIKGLATPTSSLQIMEWIRALLTKPGWSPRAFDDILSQETRMIETNQEWPATQAFDQLIFSHDIRVTPLSKEELQGLQPTALIQWTTENLLKKCPEFSFVGDFDTHTLLQQIDQVFGDLSCEPQVPIDEMAQKQLVFAPGIHKTYERPIKDDNAIVTWYVPFSLPKNEVRFLGVIKSILLNRLLALFRTKESLTYSPNIIATRAAPWYLDLFFVQIPTAPTKADTVQALLPQIFADRPITQSELDAARQPILEDLAHAINSANSWFGLLPPLATALPYEERARILKALTPEQVREKLRTMIQPIRKDSYSSMVEMPKK